MPVASTVRAILPRLVHLCARQRLAVIALAALLSLGSVYLASQHLTITTDIALLFSNSLPWKQTSNDMIAAFPQNDGLLVSVIDGRIPEEAEATAGALAARMRARPALFTQVRQPDASAYFQRNAFLLIDSKDLQDLLDRLVDAQPLLAQMVADPSLRGVFSAVSVVAEGARRGMRPASLAPALAQLHQALAAAADGHATPLSWENLLAGPLAQQGGRYRFVTTKPVLDFNALEPGGVADQAIRAASATLPYVASGDAHVRLTGEIALDDEEFASLTQGAVAGLGGSFVLVCVWLFAAMRSWRLAVPIALTLLVGLLLTTGFAALAVGSLNLISIAFAILFVGIAVDFAIQFTVRFRERRHIHADMWVALRDTARISGAQILVAALATASGFLAFTPTAFVGVAQLGIIAGGGMLIAFVCTLTLLPSLLTHFKPALEDREVGVLILRRLEPVIRPLHWPILVVFGMATLAGAAVTPGISFDGDPLNTKNQHSEGILALKDLMNEPVTNPYTIDALMPSLDAAARMTTALSRLGTVQDVLSLNSFVPADQATKLAAIADAATVLAPTLIPPAHVPAVSAADLRASARALGATLRQNLAQSGAGAGGKLGADDPLRAISGDVDRLQAADDATLLADNDALVKFLPAQLEQLRTALAARPVTMADVPADLKHDWLLPDGRARLQVLPKSSVKDSASIRRFVDQVSAVMPQATGAAVWIVRSAQTIIHAFIIAAIFAIVVIAALLCVALRRIVDVALVMTPMMVSALLTALVMRVAGISLNFVNIIALPLLLGVGVSFNIYFVMNWRSGITRVLGSATARGVIFSALTTGTAFGSLALSYHPGSASMGALLLISLGCTVATTLVFVPALLAVMPRPRVILGGVKPESGVTQDGSK
jgi:hopanoid biosynthesis associated RND transporter like protein HpnN